MGKLVNRRSGDCGAVMFATLGLCMLLATLAMAFVTVAALQFSAVQNEVERNELYWSARGAARQALNELTAGNPLPGTSRLHVPTGDILVQATREGSVWTVSATAEGAAGETGIQFTYDAGRHIITQWQDSIRPN